jgi:dolichol-phosphate mannosyltransferase
MGEPDVSIVVPCYNERENLRPLLAEVAKVLDGLGARWEMVITDDASTDGSWEEMCAIAREDPRLRVQRNRKNGGETAASWAGMRSALGRIIVTMDADLSHEPSFIEELWKRREEADVLIASRWVRGGGADMSRFRALLSHILNRTFRLLLALPFHDISSGYRLYRRSILKDVRPEARDFDFLEEILIRAHNLGCRIVEVPFYYKPRGSGSSHARLIKFGWAYVKTLARMWRLRRK